MILIRKSFELDLAIEDKKTNELVEESVINEYDNENQGMNFHILIGKRGRK